MLPDQHARWWAGLTPAEKEAAIQEFPEYVGKGDGIPAADRTQANTQLVDRDISQSQAIIADVPSSVGIGSHTSYYQRGTESLENLGRIVSGHGDEITHENRRSTNDVIDGWLWP